jgi:hypothetical protein
VPPPNATKGQIPLSLRAELLLPLLGDWKSLPPLLGQELTPGLTLNRYMEAGVADIIFSGSQPDGKAVVPIGSLIDNGARAPAAYDITCLS